MSHFVRHDFFIVIPSWTYERSSLLKDFIFSYNNTETNFKLNFEKQINWFVAYL